MVTGMYFYHGGILIRRAWEMFNKSTDLSTRDKLLAMKLIIDCNESKFVPSKKDLQLCK